MPERYEIRDKIGQGGLGTVFRAFDRHLKREVALKRIRRAVTSEEREEAARQLEQEISALAALQHPNIVSIYDVGQDELGPFVIMELVKGETIDEVATMAPLTFADFRDFSYQIQEGLIAAQDLGLVHRDLKPSNVMVSWLPSGKFQVKLVDFGLAKFLSQPSQQTTDLKDAIFGSISFMSPEQFERGPLGSSSDMYSIGCVYYFALAGRPPFEGETGPQVMAAHLAHRVTPLAELRPDVPQWAADWVMWHLHRQPGDRPPNAREALARFIELDNPPSQIMSQDDQTPEQPRRSRLHIPGAAPTSARIHIPGSSPASHPAEEAVERPQPAPTGALPQPLVPPAGAPPSVHAAGQSQGPAVVPLAAARPGGTGAVPGRVIGSPAQPAIPEHGPVAAKKGGLSLAAKSAIVAVLAILLSIVGVTITQIQRKNQNNRLYNEMVRAAAADDAAEIPVDARKLDILLKATGVGTNRGRETVYKALSIAKSTDGTPVTKRILDFATTQPMAEEIRGSLLGRVLKVRADPSIIKPMLTFAQQTDSTQAAAGAIMAIGRVATEDNFDDLMKVLQSSSSPDVQRAVEAVAAEVLRKATNRDRMAAAVASVADSATNSDVRRTALRLIGLTGSDKAKDAITRILNKGEMLDQLAAAEALSGWPNDSMFPELLAFLDRQDNAQVHEKAFNAAFRFLSERTEERPDEAGHQFWKDLSGAAKSERELGSVVNTLGRLGDGPWAIDLVESIGKQASSDKLIDRAVQAADLIRDRIGVDDEGD